MATVANGPDVAGGKRCVHLRHTHRPLHGRSSASHRCSCWSALWNCSSVHFCLLWGLVVFCIYWARMAREATFTSQGAPANLPEGVKDGPWQVFDHYGHYGEDWFVSPTSLPHKTGLQLLRSEPVQPLCRLPLCSLKLLGWQPFPPVTVSTTSVIFPHVY